MAGREHMRLTDAAIARLRPREREYTVWDTRIPGLGVRVRPSGGRSWVLLVKTDGRSKRVSFGPTDLKGVAEARRECRARLAEPEAAAEPMHAVPLFRDFVAGTWKEAHLNGYKPSSRRGISALLNGRLLPAFGSKPLDRISQARVRKWFDEFSRTAPGNANHGLATLRQIMNFAVACGHIDVNPMRGLKMNRRPALTRFLSRDEVTRLHDVLDRQTRKGSRQQAEMIRLLMLTGCRRGEIVNLRWSEVREDLLELVDSKTGPRPVPLGAAARRILERQPRNGSPFVFPSPINPDRPRSHELPLWNRVRREAGIEDVRLHDLRHTFASHAVMNGVPVPVVSRLLGHSNTRMTLRYAHLGDWEVAAAAERIGEALARVMTGERLGLNMLKGKRTSAAGSSSLSESRRVIDMTGRTPSHLFGRAHPACLHRRRSLREAPPMPGLHASISSAHPLCAPH